MKPFRSLLFLGGSLLSWSATHAQPARVQVIHNCADLAAVNVDVWLDNSLLLDDFAFRTASPFIDAPTGVPFIVGIAPPTSTMASDAIFTQSFTLTAGETYVIVASGIASGSGYSPAAPFSLEVFDQGREVAASGSTSTDVLVYHGSTDAPTVDVYESAVVNTTIVEDASYSDFAGYLELPTLDFTLQVRPADNSAIVVAYIAPLATLGLGGTAITVLASGFLDPSQNSSGPAFGLWVALPTGGALVPLPSAPIPTARVQVIHNSADVAAAEVDVYLNGALLLDDFAFRTASPFVDLQAGVDLSVAIAPGTSTSVADAIATFPYNLAEGETYILVANGIVSGSGYSPLTPFDLYVLPGARETATSGAGNTDILVFHGCTDAPVVDVAETAVLAGATIVDDLGYGNFSGYIEVPTNDYVLQVQDENGNELLNYSAPLLTLGLTDAAITVLASGFLDPGMNSSGPGLGLWVALANGGPLVPLPLATSVEEISAIASATIYPNPANDVLNMDFDVTDVTRVELSVVDAAGRLVSQRVGKDLDPGMQRIAIPVNTLHNGQYRVRLISAEGVFNVPFNVIH